MNLMKVLSLQSLVSFAASGIIDHHNLLQRREHLIGIKGAGELV